MKLEELLSKVSVFFVFKCNVPSERWEAKEQKDYIQVFIKHRKLELHINFWHSTNEFVGTIWFYGYNILSIDNPSLDKVLDHLGETLSDIADNVKLFK